MENPISQKIDHAVKNWWLSLIIGILFAAMGIWMLLTPMATFAALVILFSVFMFTSGVFEIAFAVSNHRAIRGWGWYLVVGIIDLLLGGYLMFHPGLTAIIIPLVIAFWLMFRGFTAIGFAIDARSIGLRGWGWYLAMGSLAVGCSLLVIWQPVSGMVAATLMAALAFLFIGIFRILLSVDLHSLSKNAGK